MAGYIEPASTYRWVFLPNMNAYGISSSDPHNPEMVYVYVLPDYMSIQFINQVFPMLDSMGDKEDVHVVMLALEAKDVVFGEPVEVRVVHNYQFIGDGMKAPGHLRLKIYIDGLLVYGQPDKDENEVLCRVPPRVFPTRRLDDDRPALPDGDSA